MPQTKESYLKGRSTGWLLKALNSFRIEHGCECSTGSNILYNAFDPNSNLTFTYLEQEIRDELAKRPHQTNKKERKAKRK